jgi:hypothetical protein
VFDDIIQPKEEFYGGDDSPIEFEMDWELDEDANVSYSFSDLEEALKIKDLDKAIDDAVKNLDKAIDDAVKEQFGDDYCDCGEDECSECAILPEPDCRKCDDYCDCDRAMEDL